VDAQRADLRELNELNFSRFTAELQAGLTRTDARIGALEAALAKTDADLRREMETGFARLEMKIEQRTADIMKWSFVFWVVAPSCQLHLCIPAHSASFNNLTPYSFSSAAMSTSYPTRSNHSSINA